MSSHRRAFATIVVLCFVFSCSDDEGKSHSNTRDASTSHKSSPSKARDAEATEPETDAAASSEPADASVSARDSGSVPAARDSGSAAPMRDSGSDQDAAKADDLVPLPAGSSEHNGIVNFVDAAAAAQLEMFLVPGKQVHPALREGLTQSVNLFLQHYSEVYDFLYVFTDHTLNSTTIGKFETVNAHAAPGGAADFELALGGYRSNGRLKGVIGVQWRTPVGPPLAHEFTHYWAVQLDPRFGFGMERSGSDAAHWGFTSVHGQLGGFDGTSLRCQTPAGASPPNCTALETGRTRYVAKSFFPNSNPAVPYAPLELYLMGLLPKSEVPSAFLALDEAELVESSQDAAAGTVVVEAAGVRNIAFADIIARHGEIKELPASERKFRAAFIVVSAQPAAAKVLDDVAQWAAAFGKRGTSGVITSFEELAGGRATLDTQLGPRRAASDPAPEPRKALTCNVLAQDCPRAELACYGLSVPVCALSDRVAKGATCDEVYACEPGLDCFSSPDAPDTFKCMPYCEPDDANHAKSCQKICDGTFVRVTDSQQKTLGAFCAP
jgi:hypothetical protein